MRAWVFPILRILLVAVIAVALAKLAFFPDRVAETGPAEPTGAVVEPRTVATLGTITNDVVLDATVTADPARPVKATAVGTVNRIYVSQGSPVGEGEVVLDVKVTIERSPEDSVDAEGKPLPPLYRYVDVTSPIAGTLSALDVIPGQDVSIGATIGQVAPPTFSVSGSLQPAQQYRLTNQPTEASVAITGGPAPFVCGDLRVTTPLAGASSTPSEGAASGDPAGSGGGSGGGTTVTCSVPGDVTVFAGLAATMTIAGGQAEDVVIVPTTAVRGAAQSGTVWVSSPDGTTEERAVALGLTDGSMVQITEGLAEGEEILEFAPGAAAVTQDGCMAVPGGGMVCDEMSQP